MGRMARMVPAPAPARQEPRIVVAHNDSRTLVAIARVCHEVNRGLCLADGDASQSAWEDAPLDVQASAVDGVAFVRANPDVTPEMSHDNWCAFKRAEGWVYGPVKDAEARTHPCLAPYADLPLAQRTKDYAFLSTVRALLPRHQTRDNTAAQAIRPRMTA